MAVEWLSEKEKEIFKFVKNNADKYAEKIYYDDWKVYADPHSDVLLDKLETVMFSPKDVTLGEVNWLNGKFGTKDDYYKFNKQRNKDVKFCVYQADEYLDASHPAFKDVDIEVVDFTGKGVHPQDGHGTAVASQYGASDPRYCPFPQISENQLKIVAGVVLYGGTGDFANIVKFVDFVAGDAPKKQKEGYYTILNMSLGADAPTPPALEEAIASAWDAGVFVLVANGNSGLPKASTPASATKAQGVMALTPEMEKAQFSNYGPTTVFAEGGVMNIVANRADKKWAHQNGTSFSSPYVVNMVVATLSLYSEHFKKATDCLEYLQNIMQDLGEKGRDNFFGFGKPKLARMLDTDPAKDVVKFPDTPKQIPLKRITNVKSIRGWEISWKKPDSLEGTPYNTIFVEELDFSYEGFLTTSEVEEQILPQIEAILDEVVFEANPRDYTDVAQLVMTYITKKLEGVKITYALIDDNRDSSIQVELAPRQLAYWCGKRSVYVNNTLIKKDGAVLLRTL